MNRVAPEVKPVTGNDKIEHASLTDVGIRRSNNQDSHAVLLAGDDQLWQKQGHIFLVADGMGAHAVGELASELAASIIPLTYHKYAENGANVALQKAFVEANASIHERGQQNRDFQGMGTTGTALLLRPEGAWIGHVGDSRAYRIRDGHIEQLSFDHSLVWELARRQKMKPEELQGIPTNVIVRSLGPDSQVQVDVEGPHPVRAGDVFLLCSDGLSGQLSDHEIGVLASTLSPAEACQFLIDLANLRGGPDNITVVIVRVNDGWKSTESKEKVGQRRWMTTTWPIGALLVGFVFATQAIHLIAERQRTGGLILITMAGISLLLGLWGLFINNRAERTKDARPVWRPRLKVYGDGSSHVDETLLNKLIQAQSGFAQFLRDKEWDADWETVAKHQQIAEKCRADADLVGCFREYCRSMRPLSEALHRQRHKTDVLPNFWEKS